MPQVQNEPSLKDQLLDDYNRLERKIERASNVELWELADWLAKYVPNNGRTGRPPKVGSRVPTYITLADLAEEGIRSENWLRKLRKVASDTEADRMDDVTPSVYIDALAATKGDLTKANARLQKRGYKKRDQRDNVESVAAIIQSIKKKPKDEQAKVAKALYHSIGPVVVEAEDDEPDEEPDEEPRWQKPDQDGSKTNHGNFASCGVPDTVKDKIEVVENALNVLLFTEMYTIGKRDKTRLKKVLTKGLEAIDG